MFANFCPFQDLETPQIFVNFCPFQESGTTDMLVYFCSILVRLYSQFALFAFFCPSILSICIFLRNFVHFSHIFCRFQGAKSKKCDRRNFNTRNLGCRVGSCRAVPCRVVSPIHFFDLTPNNALALRASKNGYNVSDMI